MPFKQCCFHKWIILPLWEPFNVYSHSSWYSRKNQNLIKQTKKHRHKILEGMIEVTTAIATEIAIAKEEITTTHPPHQDGVIEVRMIGTKGLMMKRVLKGENRKGNSERKKLRTKEDFKSGKIEKSGKRVRLIRGKNAMPKGRLGKPRRRSVSRSSSKTMTMIVMMPNTTVVKYCLKDWRNANLKLRKMKGIAGQRSGSWKNSGVNWSRKDTRTQN